MRNPLRLYLIERLFHTGTLEYIEVMKRVAYSICSLSNKPPSCTVPYIHRAVAWHKQRFQWMESWEEHVYFEMK